MSDIPVQPIGYYVLLRVDRVSETVDKNKYSALAEAGFTQGTDTEQRRRQAGQIWGTLLAKGETAFTNSKDWGEDDRELMKDGVRVLYERYAGLSFEDVDVIESSPEYIICADSCIKGIVNSEINILED